MYSFFAGPEIYIFTFSISTVGRACNPKIIWWVTEVAPHVQDTAEGFTCAILWNSIEITTFQPINFYKIKKAVFDPLEYSLLCLCDGYFLF